MRDIHKTTDFNLDRFMYLGYQLKGINAEHVQTIYKILELSLSLNFIRKDYYIPKLITIKEIQEAVKRVMMD